MSDRRWPSFAEIASMESTEAYDLYWHLPAATDPAKRAIIDALGNQAWKMRQEEDSGKAKRTYLPMPQPVPVEAKTAPLPPRPKFKTKPTPAPKEESAGGALFFLAGIKS